MPVVNSDEFLSAAPAAPAAPAQRIDPMWQGHGYNIKKLDNRLEAINLCLAAMGRSGVADADSKNIDAQMASREVDRVSYQTQHKGGAGWWFNRENNWELTPDQDGNIYLPNNALTVLAAKCGNKPIRGFTLRGTRLYDTVTHSFDLRDRINALGFTYLTLDLVMQLPYEDLPPSAKIYIAYRAAFNFSGQQEFDVNRLGVLEKTMTEAQIDMESEESAQQDNNYWEQSGTMNLFADMAAQGDTSFYFNQPKDKGYFR